MTDNGVMVILVLSQNRWKVQRGFTLAELLISLGILGIIATFTIPKVLQGQQSEKFNALAKEAIGAISDAYQNYKNTSVVDANTGPANITPYLNYARLDTSGALIDNVQTTGSLVCNNSSPCLRMHSGAAIRYNTNVRLNGTGALNAFYMEFDPDGTYSGSTTGSGKAIDIFVYYNGRVRTNGTIEVNTTYDNLGVVTQSPDPTQDPPWFHW